MLLSVWQIDLVLHLCCRAQALQPNLEQTLIVKSSSVSLKMSMLNSMALKVRLQGLSPAALVKSQLANARLTKPLTICAGAMAQSVEFTSLTGLPEVQRLSEILREDARWPWASAARA